MDHKAVYDRLIARARGRIIEGYSERHHVVPRTLGGTDGPDNIVRLTPEEHFVAHQLLVFIYPNAPRLIFALLAMSMSNRGMRVSRNKLFGWMRRRMAQAKSQALLGTKLTARHAERISAALKGRKHSAERTAKMRASLLRRLAVSPPKRNRQSEETKAKIGNAHAGKNYSAEAGARLRAFNATRSAEEMSARAKRAWATKRARSPQITLF